MKKNVFLHLFSINLIVAFFLPYFKYDNQSSLYIYEDPILFVSYIGFVILVGMLYLIKNEKLNHLVTSVWLLLCLFSSFSAFNDLNVNDIDIKANLLGSSILHIMLFGPIALAQWLNRRFNFNFLKF